MWFENNGYDYPLGGPEGNRTPYLLHAMETSYR